MQYTQPSFHVAPCGSDKARDEYDRIFGRKPRTYGDSLASMKIRTIHKQTIEGGMKGNPRHACPGDYYP